MNMNRLKWVAIALPLAFVAFLRLTTAGVSGRLHSGVYAHLIFYAALAIGVFFFATVIFSWLDRSQKASDARTRELEALNDPWPKADRLAGPRCHRDPGARDRRRDPRCAGGRHLPRGQCARRDGLARDGRPENGPGTRRRTRGSGDVGARLRPRGHRRRRVGAAGRRAAGRPDSKGALLALLDSDAAPSLVSASRLMYGLANHASAALERCRLFDEVQRREQRSRALYEVGLEIVSSQNVERVLRQVTEHACKLAHGRAAVLCLVNGSTERLSVVETAGDTTVLTVSRGEVLGNGTHRHSPAFRR